MRRSTRLRPVGTIAMLLAMWATYGIVYLAAQDVGAIWPGFIAVPMLLLALPASYMLFWISFNFQGRAFGIALGLWVTVMFAMTPLAIWGLFTLS